MIAVGYPGSPGELDEETRKKDERPRVRKDPGGIAFRGRFDLAHCLVSTFKYVASEAPSSGLLIVGTYRDVELGRHHPLARVLGELGGTRVALHGLSEEAIERYDLSDEELELWEKGMIAHGTNGLKTTLIQQFRQS